MPYRLVVSEKPSVAMAYAKVLGVTNRKDGYLEGGGYLVSWCIGHLVELTTLCPHCLSAFRNARGIRVRRADPYQLTKEPCTYCQTRFGYDYYIQPTSPKATYFKKGRFDDEIDCA